MNAIVLGAGSWGTALSILLARNGHEVHLLGRDLEELAVMRSCRENLKYLPGFALPASVQVDRLGGGTPDSDLVVVAVPSGAVRGVLRSLSGEHRLAAVASKGLEPGSGKLLADVVREELPNAAVGVLSGPNLAVEIARGVPTAAIAAFEKRSDAERVRDAFVSRTFRVSIGDDVVGVELAGALKNVLAIGAGLSDGLGFGDNTKGALLARGLLEMARLGKALGGRDETFLGVAGVGDLFATAASTLSRNYRLGRAMGHGLSLNEAQIEVGQVTEGVPTAEVALMLARRLGIEMPVFAAIASVLSGKVSAKQAVEILMERVVRMEDFLGEVHDRA
jgi:glycerol-3-phosphate dehydrogenase (NAD(P)+)